jgi:ubiquinone/menaquinone biosynthesis C-methylase UbiE
MGAMNDAYSRNQPGGLSSALERAYIRVVGVPEIGFRLRGMYFKRALKLLPRDLRRALDAGSGIGAYSLLLARRYPSAAVVGCDIDQSKTAFCNHLREELRVDNVSFVSSDVTELDHRWDPFDMVVCIDVLEHVPAYQSALKRFRDVLRPGGYLYVHVPQTHQRRIFRRFDNWHHDDHVREGFSPSELTKELEVLGFRIVLTRETFGFLGKLAWELNHMTLQFHLALAGALFPLLRLIAQFDGPGFGQRGLGISILAQKPEPRSGT